MHGSKEMSVVVREIKGKRRSVVDYSSWRRNYAKSRVGKQKRKRSVPSSHRAREAARRQQRLSGAPSAGRSSAKLRSRPRIPLAGRCCHGRRLPDLFSSAKRSGSSKFIRFVGDSVRDDAKGQAKRKPTMFTGLHSFLFLFRVTSRHGFFAGNNMTDR